MICEFLRPARHLDSGDIVRNQRDQGGRNGVRRFRVKIQPTVLEHFWHWTFVGTGNRESDRHAFQEDVRHVLATRCENKHIRLGHQGGEILMGDCPNQLNISAFGIRGPAPLPRACGRTIPLSSRPTPARLGTLATCKPRWLGRPQSGACRVPHQTHRCSEPCAPRRTTFLLNTGDP